MGLDAYIYSSNYVKCPHCGEDIFIPKNDCGDEICYWRKNQDLHHFINNEVTPYGDEEYGMPVELNADGVRKIIEFLCDQGPDEAGIDNLEALKSAYYDVLKGMGKLFYSADW